MEVPENTVLLVEDDACIRELLSLYLKSAGYAVVEAGSAEEGRNKIKEGRFTVVVFDLRLPGKDGFEFCRQVRRQHQIPIIILTAKNGEGDKIPGLEAGADDYLARPFSPKELLARLRAVLPRTKPAAGGLLNKEVPLKFKNFEVDLEKRMIKVKQQWLALPGKEFDLLVLLVGNPGRVFTREQILNKIWGSDHFGAVRTVDVHVQRLRKKIEINPDQPKYIRTVWGFGYRFEGDPH